MGECNECEKAKINRLHGAYVRWCLRCCARLVISARPSKKHQLTILDWIERDEKAPTRAAILDYVRENYGK